ncbi:MAG: YcxB family protein [Bacteroidota bacterium]|nr:YcxB family protein [Bacteroidota bacterium]MDP4204739.1 YcxB family protein [Bacteroidota bacterium]
MEEIIVQSKITRDAYVSFVFTSIYKKPWLIIITSISILLMLSALIQLVGIYQLFSMQPYVQLVFSLFFTVFFPISLRMQTRRSFKMMRKLQETMIYHFNEEEILIEGETFKKRLNWDTIFKIKELKHLILIYQNKNVANIVLKDSFGDKFPEFKTMVQSHPRLTSEFI